MNADEALNFQHTSDSRDASREWAAIDALAAEVRLLRTELVFAQPLFSRRQLEAKLARVRALPAKWRSEEEAVTMDDYANDGCACADELESALEVVE